MHIIFDALLLGWICDSRTKKKKSGKWSCDKSNLPAITREWSYDHIVTAGLTGRRSNKN